MRCAKSIVPCIECERRLKCEIYDVYLIGGRQVSPVQPTVFYSFPEDRIRVEKPWVVVT